MGRSTTASESCARRKRPTVNQHHKAHGTRHGTQQPTCRWGGEAGRRKSCTTVDAKRRRRRAIRREGVAIATSVCVGGRVAITRGQHAVGGSTQCGVCARRTRTIQIDPPPRVVHDMQPAAPGQRAQRLHTTGLLARCGTPEGTVVWHSGGEVLVRAPRAERRNAAHFTSEPEPSKRSQGGGVKDDHKIPCRAVSKVRRSSNVHWSTVAC